jgi:SPP1 family predicted phage head-tail adaptor
MRAGKMRRRVVLEQPVRTSDGGGGASIAWSPLATLWAAIQPLSGHERPRFESLEATLSHKITVRFRSGISPDMRFRLDTRIFNIRVVRNEDERNRWLICLCEEIV